MLFCWFGVFCSCERFCLCPLSMCMSVDCVLVWNWCFWVLMFCEIFLFLWFEWLCPLAYPIFVIVVGLFLSLGIEAPPLCMSHLYHEPVCSAFNPLRIARRRLAFFLSFVLLSFCFYVHVCMYVCWWIGFGLMWNEIVVRLLSWQFACPPTFFLANYDHLTLSSMPCSKPPVCFNRCWMPSHDDLSNF